jgi:hypothetical protein
MTTSDGYGSSDDRMRGAANWAQSVLTWVGGEGGILRQIEAGEWSEGLSEGQRADLADLLTSMAEAVRQTRALAGGLQGQGDPFGEARKSIRSTQGTGLPRNRKERFYTGTVLPMIVASDGFAHLDRLLALCGLPSAGLGGNALEGLHPVQFFTEYSFAESRFTPENKDRFPDAPLDADTPDVVIVGPDWLLCVEAKMFHKARPADLSTQMNRQKVLVDYWTRTLRLDPAKVAHILLVPERLATTGVDARVVTWEALLDAYRVVGPLYWTAVLAEALGSYKALVSLPGAGGANAHSRATGMDLKAQGVGPGWTHVGRVGGLHGPVLQHDIGSGGWSTHAYEVRVGALPGNGNWFSIGDFLALLNAPA